MNSIPTWPLAFAWVAASAAVGCGGTETAGGDPAGEAGRSAATGGATSHAGGGSTSPIGGAPTIASGGATSQAAGGSTAISTGGASVTPDAGGGATTVPTGGTPSADAGSGSPDAATIDGGTGATSPGCGDGIQQVDLGERCDQGPSGGPDCTATCTPPYEVLFHPDAVPAFYLTIPQPSWDTLGSCSRDENSQKVSPAECGYQTASIHVVYDPDPTDTDAATIQSAEMTVGLRRKGRASWRELQAPPLDWTGNVFDRPGKPSFKVKFDAFGGSRFLGLTRLTLNNGVQDPSGVRERLAYHLYRAADLAAPLATSAQLFVRVGSATAYTYWGLYVNVQSLDKRFIRYHFGEVNGAVGNLYDTYNDVYFTELDRCSSRGQAGEAAGAQEARFQLETNETLADTGDLTAAIDSVYEYGTAGGLFQGTVCRAPGYATDTFVANAETALDFDYFLREFAMDHLFTNWDGYAATRNNYKLYHELTRDRFVLFPWGTDQSFAWQDGVYYPNWTFGLEQQSSRHDPSNVMNRCIADTAVCWPRYLEQVRQARDLFDSLPLRELAATWQAQIESLVEWTPAELQRHGLFLDYYLEHRSECVLAQLEGRACAQLTCPDSSGCSEAARQ